MLRAGEEELGVLVGHLPATRRWERADQDLLELFASEVAVAIRNAELFAKVEAQNSQLLELDAAKDDFLRGVSHNLQTPLTSIRAYADQLDGDRPDRRLGIIAEQAERLSRMVRQLLTVTRLESGALHPRGEVVSLGPRVKRAWEALGAADVPFEVDDRSGGWLAIADTDQLDQVLWALLDNAVKYGNRTPVRVEVEAEEKGPRIRMTISDGGRGVPEADRARMFGRFVRGSSTGPEDGSGLGPVRVARAVPGDGRRSRARAPSREWRRRLQHLPARRTGGRGLRRGDHRRRPTDRMGYAAAHHCKVQRKVAAPMFGIPRPPVRISGLRRSRDHLEILSLVRGAPLVARPSAWLVRTY